MFHITGNILMIEALLMLLPAIVGLIYHEYHSVEAFLIAILITGCTGALMTMVKADRRRIFAKEGFVVVAMAWILMSAFGCLPFVISGAIPSFVDAFFEMTSGFTTTGASILTHVESLGYAMLFWRSFSHWVGGMGVLVFVLAILPLAGSRGTLLMKAESPGPTKEKLVPRMQDSAKILYGIYFIITVVEIILLLVGGMPLYDSLINAFGTAGTGGFSNWSDSIAHYDSTYIHLVIGVFMLLFGINFNFYFLFLVKKWREALRSEEVRLYLTIVAFSTLTIAWNIRSMYDHFGIALRDAFFQVSTIITTTGFSTTDFNLWPSYAKEILVMLMCIGACAGSTGGGLKVSRFLLLVRTARRRIRKMLHPHSINVVQMDDKFVEEDTLKSCSVFLTFYCFIALVSIILISLDNFDFETNFTAVIACFNNIGPGLAGVGPMSNFSGFSDFSKLVLSFDMLAGRLEIFPLLIFFAPSVWRS